jgi:hypothetical protein
MARITQQSSIHTTGVSYENEPTVKSDGASSDVMEWAASTGSSVIKITEGADNKLDLTVDGKPVVAGVQSDGEGLHFDGTGNIDVASPPDLSTFAAYINNGGGYSIGVNSMTVDALKAEIPSGTILTFSGGGEYLLTSTAAAGATAIVSTLGLTGAAVADNEGAAYGGQNKFSFELVIKADEFGTSDPYLIDFSNGGRFVFGSTSSQSYNLGIYDNASWTNFGVKVLDDLKVHHLVMTVDGTAATLYDNGNRVGTATISATHGLNNCTDLVICNNPFKGTLYRTRFYNKALSSAEVQTAYERADVDFADQYASQTEKIGDAANRTFASGVGNWGAVAITAVNDSGALKIPQTAAFGGGTNNLASFAQRSFLGKDYFNTGGATENNKRYRLSFDAKAVTGGSKLYFNFQNNDDTTNTALNESVTLTTSFANYSVVLEGGFGSAPKFLLAGLDAAESFWLDNVSIVAVGCVSDYELSANPTQSRMVQDRSNAADGTASASGVKQVQPVVQLNATAARIGTSAATVADGDIDASGGLLVGKNQQSTSGTPFSGAAIKALPANASSGTTNNTGVSSLALSTSTLDKYGYLISAHRTGSDGTPTLRFSSHNNSDTGTEVLTINNSGVVVVGDTPNAASGAIADLHVNKAGGGTLVLSRTTGDNNGTLGAVRFGNTDTDSTLAKIIATEAGTKTSSKLEFQTQTAGADATTRLTIDDTGLCTFSGGINLGDTTLSNYKEGTFTPTLSKDDFSTTLSSPNSAIGRYVRVGKMCYVILYYYHTTSPTTTGVSAWKIGALPFSFVQDSPYQFLNAGYVIFNGNSFNTSPYRWQVNDASAVTLYGTQSATNWTSGALEFSACGVLEIA